MEQLKEIQENMNASIKTILKGREVYLTIKDFPNYEVSNKGNVRNKTTGKILKPRLNDGYYIIGLTHNKNITTVTVHRIVANTFLSNYENKECVDHINGNKIDNDLDNLRFATKAENAFNRKKISRPTTSIFKGVSFHNRDKVYQAKIRHQDKDIHIGNYKTQDEAGRAYNEKAKVLFGDFAYLNEI